MAFWDLLIVASMPVVKVLLISGLGALLSTQYVNVLTGDAQRHLSKVVFVVFIPALTFASLAKSVTFEDLISWWYMPFNTFLTFFFGATLGWIIVKITKPPEHLKGIIVANCSAGNLGTLLVIIVPAMCQEKGSPFGEPSVCRVYGMAYASFSMALGNIFIWTYAYSLIRSASHVHEEQEIESGREEKILNIDYLNVGEKSSLLNAPEVQSPGDCPLFGSQSACSMIKVSSLPKDFNQEVVLLPCPENPSCFLDFLRKVQEYTKDTRQLIIEVLKAPPTIGVIAGFTVGAIPQVKNLFVGENAPLRVIDDSISLLGEGLFHPLSLYLEET